MTIQSTFYRPTARSEINKGLASQEKPIFSVPATDYINTPMEVVAGIKIASVYVASNIETIRLRVTEAIVFRKISHSKIPYSPKMWKLNPLKMKTMFPNKFKGTTYNYINIYHPRKMIYIF